jgi:hypothetical protein
MSLALSRELLRVHPAGQDDPACPAQFPPDVALESVSTGALSSSQALRMIAVFGQPNR